MQFVLVEKDHLINLCISITIDENDYVDLQIYGSICEEMIFINNFGYLHCDFTIHSCSKHSMSSGLENTMEVGKLIVEPSSGTIQPQSSTYLIVKYCPRIEGEFNHKFTVQVSFYYILCK